MENKYQPDNHVNFIKTLDYEDPIVMNSFDKRQAQYQPMSKSRNYPHYTNYLSPSSKSPQTKYPYKNLVSPKNMHSPAPFSSHQNFYLQSQPYSSNKINSPQRQLNNLNNLNNFNSNHNNNNTKSLYELQRTVSQLRLALHQSLQAQKLSQQQLHQQRTKNFQVMQLKRRLQQQLSKMQFQLDRINSYDNLQQRQTYIKAETTQNQNARLNGQLNDMHAQMKKMKRQHRDLMSEHNKVLAENSMIQSENQDLMEKVHLLDQEVHYIKQQLQQYQNQQQQDQKSRMNNQNYQHNNQQQQYISNTGEGLNQIVTTRTDNYQSGHNNNSHIVKKEGYLNPQYYKQNGTPDTTKPNSHNFHSNHSNHNQSENNYEQESSQLIQDYNRLLTENTAMKQLYKEFYQKENNNKQQFSSPVLPSQSRNKNIRTISQQSQAFQSDQLMLQTYQKNQLKGQIDHLKEEVIAQLHQKYYLKAINQSKKQNTNCLVFFIQQVTKNIQKIDKMVVNYLMARDILKKQLGLKRFPEPHPENQKQTYLEDMLGKVKQKLKQETTKSSKNLGHSQYVTQNINAYFLALFRILTLIDKNFRYFPQNGMSSETLGRLKHYCLKYVHKIIQEGATFKGQKGDSKKKVVFY